jgi:DNA-binding transcriptional ArsR family regulator
LTTQDSSSAIAEIILGALQQGSKNRGELFDLTGKSYPTLVQALERLKDKQLIENYFVPTGNISVLTYRLHAER